MSGTIEHGGANDPQGVAHRLLDELSGLKAPARKRRLERATADLAARQGGWTALLYLLEGIEDAGYLERLARHLTPLPAPRDDDEEGALADLVRVLAVCGRGDSLALVEHYLLERPIVAHWHSVPWAVWPRHEALFGEAWSRYFRSVEPRRWKDSATVAAFLAEPTAVAVVRDRLHPADYRRWHVLRRSLARLLERERWIGAAERGALERLVLR